VVNARYSFCKECQCQFRLECAKIHQKVTYCDDLEADQASDVENVAPGHTKKEGDGVEDVANDKLDCKIVVSVQANVASPPGQKSRNEVQERDDDKESRDNHASDLDAEPGALSKGLQNVGALVGLIFGHNDLACSESLFFLRVSKMAESQGGRDRHDAAGNQHLRVQTKLNVGDQDGANPQDMIW
jgi:hypothetical protein